MALRLQSNRPRLTPALAKQSKSPYSEYELSSNDTLRARVFAASRRGSRGRTGSMGRAAGRRRGEVPRRPRGIPLRENDCPRQIETESWFPSVPSGPKSTIEVRDCPLPRDQAAVRPPLATSANITATAGCAAAPAEPAAFRGAEGSASAPYKPCAPATRHTGYPPRRVTEQRHGGPQPSLGARAAREQYKQQ